jgi:hypothetical protein
MIVSGIILALLQIVCSLVETQKFKKGTPTENKTKPKPYNREPKTQSYLLDLLMNGLEMNEVALLVLSA